MKYRGRREFRRQRPSPALAKAARDTRARLKELKDLRAQQMISEAEYEKKRDEILKDL